MSEATTRPITPMIRNDPQPEMSFFVVYPHSDSPAKEIEVTRNTWAMEKPVKATKIQLSDSPMTEAKA